MHQVLVSAAIGDAITNAATELRSVLARLGPSEIYAKYYDPGLAGVVRPLSEYSDSEHAERDVILFHASIGEPEVASFVLGRRERVVLIYHNIAPAEAFTPYDPHLAGLLAAGRQELSTLADRVTMALADSSFNAAELEELGFRDVRVAPLIIDLHQLRAVKSDPDTERHLEEVIQGPVLLFVGQLLPHKRLDLLIEAYHLLVTYLLPDAGLILVGPDRVPRYRQALQTYIQELNLSGAWITGPVSLQELVAFYRGADAFVTASEHEGVCVPLLEAMAFGCPVVARARAAIPETLGDGGLLLPPDDSPALLAEAMLTVLTDPDVRSELIKAGDRRWTELSADQARSSVLSQLLELV